MKYAIDRIENEIAILENITDGTKIEINLSKLPSGSKEGTILLYQDEQYTIDLDEEQKRKERIESKFAMLRKK